MSRDVIFDEASMIKPTNSQQVESETTIGILQQVESDAISPSVERSVSFETIPMVTRGSGHVVEHDTDDDNLLT